MKQYFTISEFANLRNININSLRYYEKIGILKPAYIDLKTNYRYYAAEQLFILNQIILCVSIGIPLKELTKYIDTSGNLQSQNLLNQGKIIALDKMKEIQNNLNFIEYMLDNIDESKEYENTTGPYIRSIKKRRIITSIYFDQWLTMKEAVSEIAKIYKIAQKNELSPLLPAGNILEFDTCQKMRYRFFIEIANNEKQHSSIEVLPSGEYNCLQTNAKPGKDTFDVVTKVWDIGNKTNIIVANIRLEKYGYETTPSELQYFIY